MWRRAFPNKLSFLIFLLISLLTTADAQQNLRRFWTAAGQEPVGHDVDPDLGDRREFFQSDSNHWVERFADGFVVVFNVIGTGQATNMLAANSSNPTGMIPGQIVKSGNSTLEYLIPDEFKPRSILFYRLADQGTFLATTQIHLMEADQVSELYVEVAANLSKVRDTIYGAIPGRVDETNDPDAHNQGYRYRFDALTDTRHRQIGIANNRIYVAQVFAGDFETTRFLGGCHLRPLYVEADLDFMPAIVKNGDAWVVGLSEPHVNLKLLPGSDTGCSIFNINAANKVGEALDRQSLKDRVVDAVRKASVTLPTAEVWSKAQGPFVRKLDQQSVCIYPRPSAISAGDLRGNFDAASADIFVLIRPQIMFSNACPVTTPTQMSVFDGNQVSGPPHVVFDIRMPYTQVRQALLGNANVKAAGIDDVAIEPHQAYMTLKVHRHDGQSMLLNAIPTIPVPANEGQVTIDLVFADVPGAPLGQDISMFSGSYSTDVTDQINALRNALRGSFDVGTLKVYILGNTMQNILLTCETDGLHGYVDLSIPTRAVYVP